MKVNKKFRFSAKFFVETETSVLFRFIGIFGSKFFSLETLRIFQFHKNMKNYHVFFAFLAFHAETVLESGIFFRDSFFFGLGESELFWCVPLPAGWLFTGFLIGCFRLRVRYLSGTPFESNYFKTSLKSSTNPWNLFPKLLLSISS
jgi:hypothetical protein